jgi:hypothetical protein
MELTARSDPGAIYKVAKPIFYDERVIGVLEGKYVQGTVGRRSLRAYRVEQRTSFKHPIVGAVLGGVLVGVPLQAVAGDPLGLWWLTLASPMRLAGSVFMAFFGAFLLWGVIRRREQPWLVLTTVSGERAFPLNEELSKLAAEVLDGLVDEQNDPADATL